MDVYNYIIILFVYAKLYWFQIVFPIFIYFLYLHLTENHDFWNKLGVSGPKPIPLLGNVHENFYKTPQILEYERYKKYGRIYGIFYKNIPLITIGDQTLLQNIMIRDAHIFNRNDFIIEHEIFSRIVTALQGNDWKRVRSIMSKSFTSSKIKQMYDSMDTCVISTLNKLEKFSHTNADVDINDLFGTHTINVIGAVAFGIDTDSCIDLKDGIAKYSTKTFFFSPLRIFMLLFVPQKILEWCNFSLVEPSVFTFFEAVMKEVVAKRRESKQKYDDFLQLLLNACEGQTLSENELLAQCLAYFVGGYETGAVTLTIVAYLLAVHPDIQEKLFQELDEFQKKNGEINHENLFDMKYLNAVISETLRMHAPSFYVERTPTEDYPLGDTNIILPKNTCIRIPIYAIHHDAELHPDPFTFKPERFLDDEMKPLSYIPFGAGQRKCIAYRFALHSARHLFAKLVLKYRFYKSEKTEIPLKYLPCSLAEVARFTSVIVKVEKRE